VRAPIPREDDFRSRLRSPAMAARIGLWLGICFGIAFVTGLISHYAQQPHQPVPFPTRPSWGYQVTQGLHVVAGTAAVPLLLVKLWTVFPKLFSRPPRRLAELLLHGAERVSIAVLVAAAIFQLSTGLANTAQWYPWSFHFRATPIPDLWNGVTDCEVLMVEPPLRLVYSWNASGDQAADGLKTLITWTLTPTPDGVLVRMEQSGFRPQDEAGFQGMGGGWPRILGGLERVAGEQP